jgi:hypothetical protein
VAIYPAPLKSDQVPIPMVGFVALMLDVEEQIIWSFPTIA